MSWGMWDPPIGEALLERWAEGSLVAVRRVLGDGSLCVTENSPMGAAAADFASPLGASPIADLTLGVNEHVNGLAGLPTVRGVAGPAPLGAVRAEVEPDNGYDVMVGAGVWCAIVDVPDAARVRLIDAHGETIAHFDLARRPL